MTLELLETLRQILTGLKHIGNGVTYVITFAVKGFGLSASQELVKTATILILLSIIWKLGSKVTGLIYGSLSLRSLQA